MGLTMQCDDPLGGLLVHLEATGETDDTLIVLTYHHGDYLGDHWLGERDFFHEVSVKIPPSVYDPRETVNTTRGTTCDALMEAIDLAATLVDAAGPAVPDHIIEGRSLRLFGFVPQWRRSEPGH